MPPKNDLFRLIELPTLRDTSHLLNKCRKSEEFTDVKLQIGDKLYPAHRLVLSLHSPVLKAAISDQWSKEGICKIGDEYVDVEIVEDLLSFFYIGSIKLTPDNVHSICMAAHFLQIETLLEPSVKFLCELLSVENVLKLFLFSINCQLDELQNSCFQFIIANYQEVSKDSEIPQLLFENFKNIMGGLKGHSWSPMLRKNTFDSIVRWTEKNVSERLEHLPILLENIPLNALPTKFLKGTVFTNPVVKECLSFSEILSNAISNSELKTNENFIVIGGFKGESGMWKFSKAMFCYDWATGTWDQLPDISEYKYELWATVINGQDIIVSGGCTSGSISVDKVEMFDWSTQTWMTVTRTPFQLVKHAMAELNGDLYVSGRRVYREDNENMSSTRDGFSILRYSFESKQWSYVKLPELAHDFNKLIPYKDHLYAIGRYHFEKYDPAQNQWTVLKRPTSITREYWHSPLTLHQDKFYICSQDSFEMYDPETNNWVKLPAPKFGSETSLLSVNGKLLAAGGRLKTYQSQTDLIYEFDLRTNQWIEFGKLPLKLSLHQCLVGSFC